jgi:tight adherence protein C
MLAVIAICASLSILLFIIGLTMKTERALIRERVNTFSSTGEALSASIHREFEGSFNDRVVRPFLRKLSAVVNALTPRGRITSLEAKLETAGHPLRLEVKEFLGLQVLCLFVFLVIAYGTWMYFRLMRADLAFVGSMLLVIIGLLLPDYLLQRAVQGRQAKIRKALPDTIDLLTVSVEAGVGVDGAMAKVSEKMTGPLTDELVQALEEMRLGKSRMQALRDMANRIGMVEVSTFVAALYQAEQLGVSIAKVLRVQGDTMRVRRSQMAREMASKLPVKMLFPLVFFIFPALFVVVMGPGVIEIYRVFSQ